MPAVTSAITSGGHLSRGGIKNGLGDSREATAARRGPPSPERDFYSPRSRSAGRAIASRRDALFTRHTEYASRREQSYELLTSVSADWKGAKRLDYTAPSPDVPFPPFNGRSCTYTFGYCSAGYNDLGDNTPAEGFQISCPPPFDVNYESFVRARTVSRAEINAPRPDDGNSTTRGNGRHGAFFPSLSLSSLSFFLLIDSSRGVVFPIG